MIRRLLAAVAWLAACLAVLPGAARAADTPWGPDFYPNVPLQTQDGRTVRFYDDLMKDKRVLVNFIFTSCDQVCPLDTAKMVQVYKLLGEHADRDIHVYSITLDPETDTPAVLKSYAARFGAKWTFLTGKRADIDKLRDRLGERNAKETHANTVRVGDVGRAQWIRIPLAAESHYIASEVRNMFNPNWSVGKSLASIADAPRPEVYGPGQVLFNNRCAACHAFGRDHLGPDLNGVTARRELPWLARFIAAPDKMRAAGDPTARELSARYQVVMPNLGLTRRELGDVIAYLQAKSVTAEPPAEPAPDPVAANDPHAGHVHHHAH